MGKELYAQQQDRFRKQLEGDQDDLPEFKPPEVNPEHYRDVESLLFRGFLTVAAEINGVLFVFKSLNHHEFGLIRMMGDVRDGLPPPQKFWDIFLAYGVLMVEGQNILPERDRWLLEISSVFADFAKAQKNTLIRHLSELNRKSASAVLLTEAYASETYSRLRWAQLRDLDMTTPAVTGVPGTERLGLNWAQLVWRALNHFEDLHTQIERDWENAKFVGSCMAGKGIQKIYSQDDRRRRTEREAAWNRKDRLLRHVLLGDPIDEKQGGRNGTMVVARTVEDLVEQRRKELQGEKDWHDEVVERIEQQARDEQRRKREEIEALMAANEERFSGRHLEGETDFTGLTQAQVGERITLNKQLEAQTAASKILHPELYDERYAKGLQRWGLLGQTPNNDPSERRGRPFRSR